MRAPISSIKHIIQHTQFIVTSLAVTTNLEVNAVNTAGVSAPNTVVEGSVIKAVYIELWLLSDETEVSSYVLTVEKAIGAQGDPTFTQMTTLDAYVNKKNVLYSSQGLLAGGSGSSTGNPTPVLRQWIKIPKGKQRFGLFDRLKVNIAAIGAADIEGCGLTIYKSYN